jgi:hypothetical protein
MYHRFFPLLLADILSRVEGCANFTRTTQDTQPVYFWEGVFTTPLHINGSYSIVACVFVAAEMCLPSRCLAMNVTSNFAIPALGRRVTIALR